MGQVAILALILATPLVARQESFASYALELDRKIALGEETEDAVYGLWDLIGELEPAVTDGSIDLDRAQAFVVAVCRLAQLSPEKHPEGFEALPFLELACVAADTSGTPDLRANAQLRFGEGLLRSPGHVPDIDAARDVFTTALEELPTAKQTRPFLLLALAKLERDFGSLGDALDHSDAALQSLSYAQPGHRPLLEASLAGLMAELEISLGTPDRALIHVQRIEALASQPGSTAPILACLARIHLLLATRQWARAHRYASTKLKEEPDLPDPYRSALELARGHAGVIGGIGGTDELRSIATALSGIANRSSVELSHRLGAAFWSAEASWRLGDRRAAKRIVALARRTIESITDQEFGQGLSETAFWLHGFESRIARFEGADRSRLEALRGKLDRSLETLITRWEQTPLREGGVGFLHFENRRFPVVEAIELAIQLDPEEGPREGLDILLRLQGRGTFSRAHSLPPRLENPFEGLVDDENGCLFVLQGLHQGHVFAVDAKGVVHGRLRTSGELEERRRRLIEEVSSPPSDPKDDGWMKQAEGLADLLLAPPVRQRLRRWRSAHVVGADVLGYLPFEVLPLGEHLLGETLAIDYVPSAHVARFLLRRRLADERLASLDLALVTAPEVVASITKKWPEARPIPFHNRHAQALMRPFPNSREWRGSEATFALLKSELIEGSHVLHLLTHGIEDRERVQPMGLVFSDAEEGVAWYPDLVKASYPPVVIVTACEASSTSPRRGDDGVSGLATAFLLGGAEVVLMSPVRQELESAVRFGSRIHRHLASGHSAAEALRRARVSFREDGNHPFYSLVHAVGLGDARVASGR